MCECVDIHVCVCVCGERVYVYANVCRGCVIHSEIFSKVPSECIESMRAICGKTTSVLPSEWLDKQTHGLSTQQTTNSHCTQLVHTTNNKQPLYTARPHNKQQTIIVHKSE